MDWFGAKMSREMQNGKKRTIRIIDLNIFLASMFYASSLFFKKIKINLWGKNIDILFD